MEQARPASTLTPERQIQDEARPDPGRTARVAEVLTAGSAASQTTDWHSPPPGFMASPAIEPTSFACVEQGIRIEATRLLGIALAEQRRRQTIGIEGHSKPWGADDEARTRKALHLDALAAIACPGSIQVAGIRYVPESEHVHAEREGRVVAGGIEHGDGTISYCDAVGTLRRRPFEQWVNFIVMHLHVKVQSEIARRSILETGQMSQDEHAEWEADIRRRLRSDAVFALAFHPERAFAAAEALRTGAVTADPDLRAQDEADLLALVPQWEAACNHFAHCIQRQHAVTDAAEGGPGPAPAGAGDEWRAWRSESEAWADRTGVTAAEDASGDACLALDEIERRIAALPAATFAGLKLKARVGQRCDDIDIVWPDGLGDGLARDILAFVEKTPIGRPDLTDPDALTTSLLDCWAAWGATLPQIVTGDEHVPAYDRAMDRRNELLDAAEALPAAPRAIIPKALAVAWVDFVDEHRPKLSRAEHSFTGAIGLDIHAAIMGMPASAPRLTKTAAAGPDLVGLFDFGSATLTELLFLRELADLIGSTAYAFAWSGRGTASYRSGNLTPVGRFMVELGDALTEVESAAEQEARCRQPANPDDRETRLAVYADAVIRNDDPDEIAAFAAELAAHAAALREGH
ncbi:hypothetical protein Q8W71_17550 [Methylobacterium sp. NEAU 140]|uniref:hypothetical protein n=1 Tax=Methylobacterium sp. NEAU 140 TaxID=3064945 RepID=UPI002735ECF8|nr:hypothetical protein [Methylobacterium sp. NEAU 140]MDP4024433.1 hypothetical protein [Methylobacterium sp. NEAU 140]